MTKRFLVSQLFFFLVLFISTIVLISPFLSPVNFPILSLFPLFIPLVVACLLIILIILIFLRKKVLIFIIICLLLFGIKYFDDLWQWPRECSYNYPTSFTAITFNTSFFRVSRVFSDYYYDVGNNLKGQGLINYITNQSAEIICLQEFFNDSRYEPYNIIAKMETKGYDYHFLNEPKHNNGVRRGVITFSKYPIVAKGKIFISENGYNGANYTDIQFIDDTLRIINTHLESSEYQLNKTEILYSILNALSRLKKTTIKRHEQVQKLIAAVHQSPYPVLLMGDFNETPIHYNYRLMQDELFDTFLISGSGFGTTLNKWEGNIPIRIDHIFHTNNIKTTCLKVERNLSESDHFPVISTISIDSTN